MPLVCPSAGNVLLWTVAKKATIDRMAEINATTFTLGLVQMRMAIEPDKNLRNDTGVRTYSSL